MICGRKAICLFVLVLGAGCAPRPASLFSTDTARTHVNTLARDIGSRPLGSEANTRARGYLVSALRNAGFPDVQIKSAEARRPDAGLTARVHNIVALKPGRRPEAIAIVSHYDSLAGAPGATDDALGAAVAVEAGRALAGRGTSQHGLMVLITDGEEAGLLGAAAAAVDRDIGYRIVTYLNVDSIGSTGPSLLFESGPGNGWLVQAWARAAPRPRGASFAADIYRRLPNDTDFSILKRTGAPGLNFAPVGDSFGYHTSRDTADRLSDATIRQTGENIVAIVEALDRMDLARRTMDQQVYFDIGRRIAVTYGPLVSLILTILALVAGLLGWFRVALESVRLAGPGRLAFAALWANLGLVACFAAMTLATTALRASREAYHPWYAHPGRLYLLLAATGGGCAWAASRAGALLPERWHGVRHPALVWTITLPIWIVIAALASVAAPMSAFLWTLPLAVGGMLLLVVPPGSVRAVRIASAIVLAVVTALWADNLAVLGSFTVAVLGRLPVVTPTWIFPAIVVAGAIVFVPPAIAAIVGQRRLVRPAAATALALVAVAAAFGWAWTAPAYTDDRPLRRSARYVQDATTGTTFWEVAGIEPGLDLSPDAPAGWTMARDDPALSVPLGGFAFPFVFRRLAPVSEPRAQPPAAATMAVDVASGTVTVRVRPAEAGLFVSIVLPDRPASASLPGTFRRGRWTARYAGVPIEGLEFSARLPGSRVADAVRVAVVRAGLPGGAGSGGLPAWLPAERTAWDAHSIWILAPLR
jgi:Peptidase family M28